MGLVVFTELKKPALLNPCQDIILIFIVICVNLYKVVGDDNKIIINDVHNLKPNLNDMINQRID